MYSLHLRDDLHQFIECSKANQHLLRSEKGIPLKMLDVRGNQLATTAERATCYRGNIVGFFEESYEQ